MEVGLLGRFSSEQLNGRDNPKYNPRLPKALNKVAKPYVRRHNY